MSATSCKAAQEVADIYKTLPKIGKTMRKAVLLLSIFLFVACSSGRLVPVTFHPQERSGTALLTEESNVYLTAENIEHKPSHMIYDLEVQNQSNEHVEIIPEHILFYASSSPFKPLNDSTEDVHALSMFTKKSFNYKERAMRAGEVERYFHERIKAKQTLGVLLVLVGAGLAIHDAVQDENDYYKNEWTAADANKAFARDVATATGLMAIDIVGEGLANSAQKDNVEAQYLPGEIFPHTTLAPGDSYRGKIFFQKKESYKYYRIIVPIGNADHVFDFRKATVDEKPALSNRQY